MWKCSSYAGMMELVDMRDLGAVTLVKGFSAVPHRGHSSVKAGSPVFINADQALRSASVPSPCKNRGQQNSDRWPCRLYLRPWWNWQTRWI